MSLPVIKRPHYHHLIAWMADKPDHIVMTADLTGAGMTLKDLDELSEYDDA